MKTLLKHLFSKMTHELQQLFHYYVLLDFFDFIYLTLISFNKRLWLLLKVFEPFKDKKIKKITASKWVLLTLPLQCRAGCVVVCRLPSLWLVSIKRMVLLATEPVWLVCPDYKWCLVSPAGYRHCRILIMGEDPPQHHNSSACFYDQLRRAHP